MTRKSYLLPALIALAAILFIVLTTRSGAISLFSAEDLTPTIIPPEILTQLAQDSANLSETQTAYPPFATQSAQTEQALQLTLAAEPTSDLQEAYPIFSNIFQALMRSYISAKIKAHWQDMVFCMKAKRWATLIISIGLMA